MPPGAGIDYPYLTYRSRHKMATKTQLCSGLRGPQRAAVVETWHSAENWIGEWLKANPAPTQAAVADALYGLAWAGDTASELLVRAQAAITAIHTAGFALNRSVAAGNMTVAWGEHRPYQWRQTVHRAATLADQIADPQLAAIIALAVLYRHPAPARRKRVGGIASDGSIASNDWAAACAVPPPLRQALATQRRFRLDTGADRRDPLLPGTTHGSISTGAIEHALRKLEMPESLWHRSGEDHFDGPDLDGRYILHVLNPIALFEPIHE